ncbi:FecR family protein [Variovorax sp. LT1R16]|uniref:FecR family protein n=1 Tax=Variovorax sp. LT1R16 TaxID=3443728 RepID=UPI003F4621A0
MNRSPSNAANPSLQQQAQAWVLRIKSGQATNGDVQALRQWCGSSAAHAGAFEEARRAWDEIGQVGNAYRALKATQTAKPAPSASRRMFLGGAFSAAGAVAVVAMVHPPLGLWPSVFELNADYRTATGEQRQIALASGARIELNTQSSLSVRAASLAAPSGVASDRDEIELIAGEAAVASGDAGRTLDIVAGAARVGLASSEVEVRMVAAHVCVTCLRGSAQVMHPERTVTLRVHEQVRYDRHAIASATPVGSALVTGWREGALVFRDVPLGDAVAEINRYRPGRVVLLNDHLAERRVSGKFQIARLDLAIDRLQEVFGATVRRLPGDVILLS